MSSVSELKRPVPAERQVRVELAAFYRLVEHLGWGEGIYNHIAARVPEEPHSFLVKQHELFYGEVTASSLVKVDSRLDLDERAGVNKVAYTTHAAVMRGRPDVNCSIHLHTIPIMAIAAHPKGLRMLHQYATRFYNKIAYDPFQLFAESVDVQQNLINALGSNRVLVMRNHGALIVGTSIEDTFTSLYRFVLCCKTQLAIEASGQDAIEIKPEDCLESAKQFELHDAGRGTADWPGWLRLAERIAPDFKN